MIYRVCTTCGQSLPLDAFHRQSGNKIGRVSTCKPCQALKAAAWYIKNKEAKAVKAAAYYQANKAEAVLRSKRYRASRPGWWARVASRRRVVVQQATPRWLTKEQHNEIERKYAHAKECQMLTGDDYHVDHVVPLQGKNVCGLHVPWNLEVLPSDLNDSKGNKLSEGR